MQNGVRMEFLALPRERGADCRGPVALGMTPFSVIARSEATRQSVLSAGANALIGPQAGNAAGAAGGRPYFPYFVSVAPWMTLVM